MLTLAKRADTEGASADCEAAAEDDVDDADDEPVMMAAAAAADAAVELTARPGGRPGLDVLDEPVGKEAADAMSVASGTLPPLLPPEPPLRKAASADCVE
jgi:hypothetical protein